MKNLQAPRTLAECDFTTGYPSTIIPTRRARLIEKVGGGAVIAALVLFVAYVITGA